jgi:hypothetical protein
MKYFAYGSNMLFARLQRRVPTARRLGPASLPGHVLRFHKHGADGSGKCNAFPSGRPNDTVHGVLYEIDDKKLSRLHAAEGPGYEYVKILVNTPKGEMEAFMYRARSAFLDDALAPYTWYQAFVVAGARENRLPGDYVSYLENLFGRRDPNMLRRLKNGWILKRRRSPRDM